MTRGRLIRQTQDLIPAGFADDSRIDQERRKGQQAVMNAVKTGVREGTMRSRQDVYDTVNGWLVLASAKRNKAIEVRLNDDDIALYDGVVVACKSVMLIAREGGAR